MNQLTKKSGLEPVKILIGVPSGDSVVLPFHRSFADAVRTSWAKIETYSVRGMNTVSARNKIVFRALDRKFDYIFFMDSDMEFPPGSLDRLLNHNKDIVGGLIISRLVKL